MRIAKLIDGDSRSLLDLGCRNRQLEMLVPDDCKYYPVDYCSRGDDTIVCDFNKYEFPKLLADIVVGSGILEHVTDYKWFIESMCAHCKESIILSYAYVEEGISKCKRHILQNGYEIEWMNSLSIEGIVEIFKHNSFAVETQKLIPIKDQTGRPDITQV